MWGGKSCLSWIGSEEGRAWARKIDESMAEARVREEHDRRPLRVRVGDSEDLFDLEIQGRTILSDTTTSTSLGRWRTVYLKGAFITLFNGKVESVTK